MTVKLVKTLGASPLVLLEKLAAAGGCTLLQDVHQTDSDGVSFVSRVVAKINDNLYIEALDSIYNLLATTPKATPWLYDSNYSTFYSDKKLAQEAVESDKELAGTAKLVAVALGLTNAAITDSILSAHSFSVLVSLPPSTAQGTGGEYDGFNLKTNSKLTLLPAKVVTTQDLPSGDTIVTANTAHTDYGVELLGTVRTSNKGFPFGILNAPYNTAPTGGSCGSSGIPNNHLCYGIRSVITAVPFPIVVSAANFRIAKSVDTSNELVNPTSWDDLPIFTEIMSDDNGLYFSVTSALGQYLAITNVDTSKGNKLSGTFPVIYRNTPYAYNPNSIGDTRIKVIGDASMATTELTMNEYVPALPIPNDSVTGGPVVTNIFAVGTDEIRGVVPGVLGCSSNLAIGTIGWLDGIKYKVSRPGRMIKIG